MDIFDKEILSKCSEIGLHLIPRPLGDDHHTNTPFTKEDEKIGDLISYFLGTLFADEESFEYWHSKRTSVDEWKRVARALRIHGLAIKDR